MFGINKLKRTIKRRFFEKSTFQRKLRKTSNDLHVFGNGYSLNNIDLSTFNQCDCYVCNEFYKIPDFQSFIDRNHITYFGLDGLSSFQSVLPQRTGLTFELVLQKYIDPWIQNDYYIVCPPNMQALIQERSKSDKVLTYSGDYHCEQLVLKKLKDINVSVDRGLIKRACKTMHTPHGMILTGLLMGYERIYLYGLDHTYVRDILNKDPMAGKHFYLESQEEVLNSNGVYKRGDYDFRLSALFKGNAAVFEIYEAQKEIADLMGCKILDNSGGNLFCFQDFDIFDLAIIEKKSLQ